MYKSIARCLIAWPIFASLALASCGTEPQTIDLRPQGNDPPDVARTLSIGGQLSTTEGSEAQAINCAAALRLTLERIGKLGANPEGGTDIGQRAIELFRGRALQAAGPGATASSIERAILRRMDEKREDGRGQAQMSIACLRSLQEAGANAPA